jgi:hypothetical protein
MSKLTEINSIKHQDLKMLPSKAMEAAERQHLINLRVSEVPRAATSLPVFFTRKNDSREWAISGLSNIQPGKSLYVVKGVWDALYQPISLRTYPLYLMPADNDKKFTFGIDEDSDAFSKNEGEPLFDKAGRPSLLLNDMQKLLESSIKEDIQTYHFTQRLDNMGLIKSIDLLVQFNNAEVQTLKGLSTVDEEALMSLSGAQLEELNKLGYMTPIHAMLMSIYQVHDVVRRNNADQQNQRVDSIRLEIARDRSTA